MNDPIVVLKFHQREYIESLAKGLVYMNTLRYFNELEDDPARSDPHEGVSLIKQATGAILKVTAPGVPEMSLNLCEQIFGYHHADTDLNLFCMHAVRLSALSTPRMLVDPENFKFGDTVAVILDFGQFIKRVETAMRKRGHQYEVEFVKYVDEASYDRRMGPFRKGLRFAYQSELRIVLRPGVGKPYPLDVGDLSDIVAVRPSVEINQLLHVVPAIAA